MKLPPRLLRAPPRRPRAVLPVPGRPFFGCTGSQHRPDRESQRTRSQRGRIVAPVARGEHGEADVAVGVDVGVNGHGGEEDDLDEF